MASASRASEISATSRRYCGGEGATAGTRLGHGAEPIPAARPAPGRRVVSRARAGRPAHRRRRRHRRPRVGRRRGAARARRPRAGDRPRPGPARGRCDGAGRSRGRSTSATRRAAPRSPRPRARSSATRSTASCSSPAASSRSGPPGRWTSTPLATTLDEHVLGALRVVQACAPLLDAAAVALGRPLLGRRRHRPLPALLGLRPGEGRHRAPGREPRRRGAGLARERRGARASSRPACTRPRSPPAASDVGAYCEETERRLRDATPPQVAAELVAFLLSDEAAGISGRLISAVWDPWRDEAGRAVLRGPTDFGRLRRIDAQRFHDVAAGPERSAVEPGGPDRRGGLAAARDARSGSRRRRRRRPRRTRRRPARRRRDRAGQVAARSRSRSPAAARCSSPARVLAVVAAVGAEARVGVVDALALGEAVQVLGPRDVRRRQQQPARPGASTRWISASVKTGSATKCSITSHSRTVSKAPSA